MSIAIAFFVGAIVVMPFWCAFGAILHAFDIDQKIILIWTDVFKWKKIPVYAIIMLILPAIGSYVVVKVAFDRAFNR